MLQLWKEGQAIIYDWIQFLQYEIPLNLEIAENTLDLSWTYIENPELDLLKLFENSHFNCKIYLDEFHKM
jgi:hypothetical protein